MVSLFTIGLSFHCIYILKQMQCFKRFEQWIILWGNWFSWFRVLRCTVSPITVSLVPADVFSQKTTRMVLNVSSAFLQMNFRMARANPLTLTARNQVTLRSPRRRSIQSPKLLPRKSKRFPLKTRTTNPLPSLRWFRAMPPSPSSLTTKPLERWRSRTTSPSSPSASEGTPARSR